MQNLKKFRSYLQAENLEFNSLNSRTDINLIIVGINITDSSIQDSYRELCRRTAEGYFVNLDFNPKNHFLQYVQTGVAGEEPEQSVEEILKKVEASFQLLDSKSMPVITEHIDFN